MAIKKDITVTVENKKSIMSDSVWIYQGDKNIDIYFTIVDNRFEFSTVAPQRYSFTIRKPDGNLLPPTEITALVEGKVKFTITQTMADELNEVGMYDILIHLYDDLDSRISIPEISFEVKQPLVTTNALTSSGFVESAILDSINDTLERLDENGNYIKTVWSKGDVITKENLNKIENQLSETSSQLVEKSNNINGVQINVMYPPVPLVGAKGDGLTDDSTVIKNIMSYMQGNGGGTVFFPKPPVKYIAVNVAIPSNVIIQGASWDTIIEQKNTGVTTDCLFNIIGGSGDISLNKKNIVFRDIQLKGTVETDAFSEFNHLVKIQGGTNILFDHTKFTGFRGDAIVITFGGISATYRNLNIYIRNCNFDGINKDNRNAISVTDVDGLLIDNCHFENITRLNMPGAIDIEPNSSDYGVTLNNITIINNTFKNIGGNVGTIAMYIPIASTSFTNKNPKNFTIENNSMVDVFRGIHLTQLQNVNITDLVDGLNIKVVNNKVRNATDRGFFIYGVKDVILRNNLFEECANSSRIGWSTSYRKCIGIKLIENTFRHCGIVDGIAVVVYDAERIEFTGNIFEDCGVPTGNYGIGIYFATGTTSKVVIRGNTFIEPTNKMTASIDVASTAVLTPTTNIYRENYLNGLTSKFTANYADFNI